MMMNTMRVWMERMAKMTEASCGRSFCVTLHHLSVVGIVVGKPGYVFQYTYTIT